MLRPAALLSILLLLTTPVAAERADSDAGKPDRKELDALLAETDTLAAKVAKIRGLPLKKALVRGIMSKGEVKARVLAKIDEEYDEAELDAEARAYKRLGLLPADADYKQLVITLFTEQIAGFYDPAVKELYIADWIDVASQRAVLAHEIDHALQDQSFDLQKFTKPIKDNADAQLARQALVEGDGLALMVEFMYDEDGVKIDPWADDRIADDAAKGGGGSFPAFDAAPLFLREALMFPYSGGLRLVGAARRHNSWKRVDEMFAKPPISTEQVLHPDRYFAGEKPIAIKAAALPSLKKWKTVYTNVLGELMLGVVFRQHGVPVARALEAAEGWGGDRLAVFAPPKDEGTSIDALVAISFSVWDAEADAVEAYDAALEAVEQLTGKQPTAPDAKAPDYQLFGDSGAISFVERKGKKVVIVLNAPAELTKLRAELWSKWK